MPRPRPQTPAALCLAVACLVGGSAAPGAGQESVVLLTDVTLFGDNTEFFNRFRDGETLLGAAGSVAFDIALNHDVSFRGGLFFNHRFGSERFAEQWRPVISLAIDTGPSRFTFGTLDTVPRGGGGPDRVGPHRVGPDRDGPHRVGPDRVGPHGLLPALQVETLAFTRPYEAGLQWQLAANRVDQDAWVSWQRLNTAAHRERFDAGLRGRIPFGGDLPVAFGYQLHHVHEGGQLFDAGPVSDSFAGGPGLIVEPRIAFFETTSIEAYAMWSKHVADRTDHDGADHGHGVFIRAAATRNGWRGHLIAWGACDWLKDEGDLNYGSRLQDGSIFRPTRHYGEVGLAKAFYDADGIVLEGAARLHRIEKDYNYSFRVVAHVDLAFPIRSR